MVTSDLIHWTREALEHLYDLGFLQRSLEAAPQEAFSALLNNLPEDGPALQKRLLRAIQQLMPTPDVPATSLAWRVYNALEYRYVRGLTQVEAAGELNISLRQLRREQDKGIEAVAALLGQAGAEATSRITEPGGRATDQIAQHEFVRLDDLLRSTLSLLDPLFSQHNVHVRATLPASPPIVWVNRMVLRQVLILILSHAARNTPDGALNVSVCARAGTAELLITTAGHPGEQPSVTAHPLSAEERNTLRDMTQQIGAQVVLPASPAPPARFALTLPVSARVCVLMVDDHPDAIELTRRYLDPARFDLVAVTQAEEALLQAQTLQPTCILLDVMMPGRDGWEILALLKSHPDTIDIPVVVCSVLRNEDLAYALGAAAVLQKPYTAGQLIETVQTAMLRSARPPAEQSGRERQ